MTQPFLAPGDRVVVEGVVRQVFEDGTPAVSYVAADVHPAPRTPTRWTTNQLSALAYLAGTLEGASTSLMKIVEQVHASTSSAWTAEAHEARVEIATRALADADHREHFEPAWDDLSDTYREHYRRCARIVLGSVVPPSTQEAAAAPDEFEAWMDTDSTAGTEETGATAPRATDARSTPEDVAG